ncbi:hypothetical protein QPK87_10350 [Kamptonema cortianum]|nr:hypothetical protein [Geitlerinema splendidum]MDK3156976.1 hypothetical protein [Kamptonema cortianum]
MSHSTSNTKGPVLSLLGFVATGLVVAGTYWGVMKVVGMDVLADYRAKNSPFSGQEGVIIKGFEMRSFVGSRLVAQADVEEGIVQNDRSTVRLTGIQNGIFHSDDGSQYHFAAANAIYGSYNNSVVAEEGVRVWTDKVHLYASGFIYDHQPRLLRVQGPVTGVLNGGGLVSQDVVIDFKKNEMNTGLVAWVGKVQVGDGDLTPWKIQAQHTKWNGKSMVYTKARGEDKETIVTCDQMTYDRENDVVIAEGNVEYFGVDANLACEKAVIERKIGKVTLTGKKVTMLVKPEDSAPKETQIPPVVPVVPQAVKDSRPATTTDPGQDAAKKQADAVRDTETLRQYPVALTATKIEYWYRKGERRAVVTGKPFARQELPEGWRELYSDRATYDGEQEFLSLFSSAGKLDVRIKNSLGDDLTADWVKVSTKKGDDSLEGEKIQGTVMINKNDLPDRDGGGGSTGSTGSTGGSPSIRGKIGN